MNKNTFFEKVGKLTFSIVLTGVLVTGIVLAGTTWNTYTDGDTISGTEWGKMVTEIQNKVNNVALGQFYTKTEADKKFLTEVNIPTIVMDMGTFQGRSNKNNRVDKPICKTGYTPKIQVNLDWFETVGNVNGDDIIGTWSVDKGSYWEINGGDYDCGKFSGDKIVRGCGSYADSKVSYTAFCSSVPQVQPVCGSATNTCDVGTPDSLYRGEWVCRSGSVSVNCGEYIDPGCGAKAGFECP